LSLVEEAVVTMLLEVVEVLVERLFILVLLFLLEAILLQ
jgi:hypothetical protein